MSINKFEEFLYRKFEQAEPGILDDDLENAFDAWLSNLEVQQLIDFGEEALAKTSIEIKEEILKDIEPLMESLVKVRGSINELIK